MHALAPNDDAVDAVEAVVAGTLCLMSCYANDPRRHHAERIAGNLARLAGAPGVTAPMRTVCRRLAERWDAIASRLSDAQAPVAGALH